MKKLIVILAALSASALCGCVSVTGEINSITGALSSPQATQAAANLKAGSQALLCSIANMAAVAQPLEAAVNAKQAIVKDTEDAYVVSGTLCKTLGGQVISTVTVPANVTTSN